MEYLFNAENVCNQNEIGMTSGWCVCYDCFHYCTGQLCNPKQMPSKK